MTPKVMEDTCPNAAGTLALHISLPAVQNATSSAFVCILYVTPACIYIYMQPVLLIELWFMARPFSEDLNVPPFSPHPGFLGHTIGKTKWICKRY